MLYFDISITMMSWFFLNKQCVGLLLTISIVLHLRMYAAGLELNMSVLFILNFCQY